MTLALEELETTIARLDALIRPIAKQRVDVNDPKEFEKMTRKATPLDRAGVREEVTALIHRIIEEYARADGPWRSGVRSLFRKFDSFMWAAGAPADRATSEGIRDELILFSIKDQAKDPRDAKLWLDDLCREARGNGVELGGPLRDVALLSNEEDRYGWGATKQWLEQAAARNEQIS